MKKSNMEWVFNGEQYIVGESLLYPLESNIAKQGNYPVVFYNKRLYRLLESKWNKVVLQDLYNNAKVFYTLRSRVFQVLKRK